jgi:F420-dependent methylenetetrahydromethanopterin dehydrogenase
MTTRDDIIRMAREAGGWPSDFDVRWVFYISDVERFARLVAAAEREEMHQAALADEAGGRIYASIGCVFKAIRARGER